MSRKEAIDKIIAAFFGCDMESSTNDEDHAMWESECRAALAALGVDESEWADMNPWS
jgi:hypothetical protein